MATENYPKRLQPIMTSIDSPSPHPARRACFAFGPAIFLVVLVVVCYWPVYQFQFVNFDDDTYVYSNRQIQRGLTGQTVMWAFTSLYFANWHPLTWISYLIDAEIFGLNASGYHITNLVLHGCNTLLLFRVLSGMTGARWSSLLAAALFAVHPMHVESVAWVSERKGLLSTFFMLLALLTYKRYATEPSLAKYTAVLVFTSLGLMAKAMLVTFPFVLLLIDYWPLNRLDRRAILEKLPLLLPVAVTALLAVLAQREINAVVTADAIPMAARCGNALVSYATYITKLAWPRDFAVYYPHPAGTLPWLQVVAATALVVTLSCGVWWTRHTRPYLVVGWLWFLGTLVPVIGLIQVGWQQMADRYAYVPAIGIYLAISWLFAEVTERARFGRLTFVLVSAIALGGLIGLTTQQVRYWRDSIALFRHALAVTRDNYLAHTNLGVAHFDGGDYDKAITHGRLALAINPTFPHAHTLLADSYMRTGRLGAAAFHYSQALGVQESVSELFRRQGDEAARGGRINEAIELYTRALDVRPDYPQVCLRLGELFMTLEKYDRATEQFSKALTLDPNLQEAATRLQEAQSKLSTRKSSRITSP